MGLFQAIRKLASQNTKVSYTTPLEDLHTLYNKRDAIIKSTQESREEYEEISRNIGLKLMALEKGAVSNPLETKAYFENKLSLASYQFLDEVEVYDEKLKNVDKAIGDLQDQILNKALNDVSCLSDTIKKAIQFDLAQYNTQNVIGEAGKLLTNRFVLEYLDKLNETIWLHIEKATPIEPYDGEDGNLDNHYANVIVRDREGCILFLKRADDKEIEPGKYCLPGGHIDENETIYEAAARELHEETNLECGDLIMHGKAKCHDGKWAFYLEAPTVEGQLAILDGESTDACWMSRDEWMHADLIFDLKDHLMELEGMLVSQIPTVSKAEYDAISDNPFYDDIEKGQFVKREGIRGGQVIGHTRSGRPIYSTFKHPAHSNFSKQDHEDAARLHERRASETKSGTNKYVFRAYAKEHRKRASMGKAELENWRGVWLDDDDEIEKAGEGSRGGKVIGHTRSGKPIYDTARHEGHKDFSKQDHSDAIDLHKKLSAEYDRGIRDERRAGARDDWKTPRPKLSEYLNSQKNHNEQSRRHAQAKFSSDYSVHNSDKFTKREQDENDVADEEIQKALDGLDDYFDELRDTIVKGKPAQIGEIRKWADGIERVKTSNGWIPTKKSDRKKDQEPEPKRHSAKDLAAHAENTSEQQLKKVAADESRPQHIRDAAQRELERRAGTKDNKEPESTHEQKKRLGIQKQVKEKKPAFTYPEADTLSPEARKVEKRFGKYLTENYKEAKTDYEQRFGNVLNADNARDLSPDYMENKQERSSWVHEPASAFIKKMYEDALAKKPKKGQANLVYFTGGGTGAGKTSGLMGKEKKFHDMANIVYDTNMNGFGSAKKKIDQALAAGRDVRINYTFRDPVEAFENGAVPRSLRIGRTVPIEEHIKTHLGSMDSIQALKDHYKNNKKVTIVVTDNSRGLGNAKRVPISFVKEQEKKYIASDLREKLHSINNRLLEQGKITESHHRGFRGHVEDGELEKAHKYLYF